MLFGPKTSPALFSFFTYNFFLWVFRKFFLFPFMLTVEFTAPDARKTDRRMQMPITYEADPVLGACVCSHFRCDRCSEPLWTVVLQAPLPVGFSRQERWSGWSCPPPGIFPTQGWNSLLTSAASAGRFFTTSATCWSLKQNRVLGRKSWTNWQTDGRRLRGKNSWGGPTLLWTLTPGAPRGRSQWEQEKPPCTPPGGRHQSSLF